MTRIEKVPSPSGRNDERLYMFRLPKGVNPKGALDVAMKKFGDQSEEKNGEAASKRELMERGLAGFGDTFPTSAVMDVYDAVHGCAPGHNQEGFDQEEGEFERDRDEEEAADAEGEIPHNAHENGFGGATKTYGDRRAHDRKLAADSADDWFEECTRRILPANSFR
jgi:hypothetical protein